MPRMSAYLPHTSFMSNIPRQKSIDERECEGFLFADFRLTSTYELSAFLGCTLCVGSFNPGPDPMCKS
jgi:hypothetical protein